MVRNVSTSTQIRNGVNTPEINGVIHTKETVVNPIYARACSPRHVTQIVNNFDPRKIGTIVVCDIGDNKYEIIDGQHRVEACKRLKHEWIEVHVLENMSLEERAEFYHSFNTLRKPLSSIEKFKARLIEGDGESVAIHEICKRVGMQIMGIDTTIKQTVFPVTRSIDKLIKIYSMGLLDRTVRILYNAYDNEPQDWSKEAFGNYLLDNISKVLYSYRTEIDDDRLTQTIAKAKSGYWNAKNDSTDLQMKTYGGATKIVEAYNKGLAEAKRLDFSKLFAKKVSAHIMRKTRGIDKG